MGGLAVFLHVEQLDPIAARLTPDVDVAIARDDLNKIKTALRSVGFELQLTGGQASFLHRENPRTTSPIRVVFSAEKIRSDYLEPVPVSRSIRKTEGILIAPVADLVLMKLTSYRLKDKVHIQDMDSVGLITPEIEAGLSDPLRARLAEVRATE